MSTSAPVPNIPLPPNTPCPVRLVVFDAKDPEAPPVHDRTGDHQDRTFRDWVTNTTWWALRNGKSVAMYPVE